MSKNPQFRPEQQLKVGGKFEGVSKYGDDYYDKGRAEKRDKAQFPHNQIMPEGGFEGGSTYTGNYDEKEMSKNPQFRPEQQLKVGGKFEGTSKYGDDYYNKGGA